MKLKYKGYITKIEYSTIDNIFYGKIENINDLVNFESKSLEGVKKSFHNAVKDYLKTCKKLNITLER